MHVIIIGTGHAGINAASIMRQNSDEIDITMVSEDRFPPYPRPSIYKIILGKSPSQIFRYPENWYDKNNINLLMVIVLLKFVVKKNQFYAQTSQN
ncbi:FAD-dependent oxidoreductase [Candidatus Hodarchaeum mangrovi]